MPLSLLYIQSTPNTIMIVRSVYIHPSIVFNSNVTSTVLIELTSGPIFRHDIPAKMLSRRSSFILSAVSDYPQIRRGCSAAMKLYLCTSWLHFSNSLFEQARMDSAVRSGGGCVWNNY